MIAAATRLFAQPQWLFEHASLYGELAQTEAKIAAHGLVMRAVWGLLALGLAAVAVNLIGVALILVVAGPALGAPHKVVALVVIPLLPALGAGVAAFLAAREGKPWFIETQRQAALDVAWAQGRSATENPQNQPLSAATISPEMRSTP